MNSVTFRQVATWIKNATVHVVFALFEAHTQLRPLIDCDHLHWSLIQIPFTAKYTEAAHAVAKIAYLAEFALRGIAYLVTC